MTLEHMQASFKRLIVAPDGVGMESVHRDSLPANDPDALICGDERLRAVERLQIYATAYFLRLLDCLKENYPVLLKVVGDDDFRELIREYLAAHPSNSPSIFHIGRAFPQFVRAHRLSERWPFAGDLACLERTFIQIFHAADADLCSVEEMRAVRPEKWPALRFRTQPAVAILECEWPVEEIIDALDRADQVEQLVPRRGAILIWRKANEVYCRRLDNAEDTALRLVERGTTLGEVCEAVADLIEGDTVTQLNQMLQRWLCDAVLAKPYTR